MKFFLSIVIPPSTLIKLEARIKIKTSKLVEKKNETVEISQKNILINYFFETVALSKLRSTILVLIVFEKKRILIIAS